MSPLVLLPTRTSRAGSVSYYQAAVKAAGLAFNSTDMSVNTYPKVETEEKGDDLRGDLIYTLFSGGNIETVEDWFLLDMLQCGVITAHLWTNVVQTHVYLVYQLT